MAEVEEGKYGAIEAGVVSRPGTHVSWSRGRAGLVGMQTKLC